MPDIFRPPFLQPGSINGIPLAGAKLYFYTAGTTSAITVYQDYGLTTPHASPVEADSAGIFPAIYVNATLYKIVLYTALNVLVKTYDNVVGLTGAATVFVTSRTAAKKITPVVDALVYLTEGLRSGPFIVRAGTPPADTQEGIYIVMNTAGYYLQRDFVGPSFPGWFGVTCLGIDDDTAALNAWTAIGTDWDAGSGCIFKTTDTWALATAGKMRGTFDIVHTPTFTTKDIITVGGPGVRTEGWDWQPDYRVKSTIQMTGDSFAFHAIRTGYSTFAAPRGFPDGPAPQLKGGIWVEGGRINLVEGSSGGSPCFHTGDAIRLDCWEPGVDDGEISVKDVRLIVGNHVGIHCSGGMGGNIINCGVFASVGSGSVSWLIDNATKAATNREWNADGASYFDGGNFTEHCIVINDSAPTNGRTTVNCQSVIGSSTDDAVLISAMPDGYFSFDNNFAINIPGGYAFKVNDASAKLDIGRGAIFGFAGSPGGGFPIIGTDLLVPVTNVTWQGSIYDGSAPVMDALIQGEGMDISSAPAVTSTGGAITTYTSLLHRKKIGQEVDFELAITITTNGAASGVMQVAMPEAAVGNAVFKGREGLVGTWLGAIMSGSSTMNIVTDASGYPGLNGAVIVVSGRYRIA